MPGGHVPVSSGCLVPGCRVETYSGGLGCRWPAVMVPGCRVAPVALAAPGVYLGARTEQA
eukprot:15439612-Alexandrium_andersonii.AAC.1